MASFSFTLNARFGYGIRPGAMLYPDATAMLAALNSPDPLAARFERPSLDERYALQQEIKRARRDQNENVAGAQDRYDAAITKSRQSLIGDMSSFIARHTLSDNGFRERLVSFWADHFTVAGKNQRLLQMVAPFVNNAIRPNITGSFAQILTAVVTDPGMLEFLDQSSSIGPNSPVGKRRGKGLNENLAREILELHTMGVGASYTQDDVRQFAELLTGLTMDQNGYRFVKSAAEPGAEIILGKSYGGGKASFDDIAAFLNDLAVHPETAAHIARKLAVHFIDENPSPDLVLQIEAAYRTTDGDLMQVYAAMLAHPAAGDPQRKKVKWPVEYIVSGLRALNLGEVVANMSTRDLRRGLAEPMQAMGMDYFRAGGPDGWSEAGKDWITPPTLAARIEWATALAKEYGQDTDPRELLPAVLGDHTSDALKQAVAGAESKWEGVALLLISPEFNKR